jgi:hypothetical protein
VDTAVIEEAVLDRAKWDLLLTARTIGCEKRFRPQPGVLCRRCDFKPICPARAKPGKKETAEAQQGDPKGCCGAQKALAF